MLVVKFSAQVNSTSRHVLVELKEKREHIPKLKQNNVVKNFLVSGLYYAFLLFSWTSICSATVRN